MTKRNGFAVIRKPMAEYDNKHWMIVYSKPEGSPPSFQDWFDMIRVLCHCEIVNYGGDPTNELHWRRWTDMPRRFFWAAFDPAADYETLRDLFNLPR